MPKNKVTDPITDQEMAFARLVLSGTMTDQQAAEAVGLNPNTAAYTKSKPSVRACMLEHRARMQQQLVAQETEGLRRQNLSREQVLARLWEIANLSPEMTRNSITSQVRALAMIIAIEGLIPGKVTDRRAGTPEKKPVPPAEALIDASAWLDTQQAQTTATKGKEHLGIPRVEPAAVASPDRGHSYDLGKSAFTNRVNSSDTQLATRALFAADTRFPFSIPNDPYARRR